MKNETFKFNKKDSDEEIELLECLGYNIVGVNHQDNNVLVNAERSDELNNNHELRKVQRQISFIKEWSVLLSFIPLFIGVMLLIFGFLDNYLWMIVTGFLGIFIFIIYIVFFYCSKNLRNKAIFELKGMAKKIVMNLLNKD